MKPGRRGAGAAGLPGLEPRWTRPTAHEEISRDWMHSAAEHQENRDRTVLPAFFPVAAGDWLVYRSHRGVHALDARTGREVWEAPSAWSIDRMLTQPACSPYLKAWVNAYLDLSPQVLFGNALLGTLGADGARVYAVDDLAIPPYRDWGRPRGRAWRMEVIEPDFGPELVDAASRAAGCSPSTRSPASRPGKPAVPRTATGPLSDSYFLGPPLAIDDRLYVLVEKDNELSLVCLAAASGELLDRQTLAYAPTRLLLDPGPRIQAVQPVYSDGILVCPTNAGVVLGVDVATPGLAWAYPYRTAP